MALHPDLLGSAGAGRGGRGMALASLILLYLFYVGAVILARGGGRCHWEVSGCGPSVEAPKVAPAWFHFIQLLS